MGKILIFKTKEVAKMLRVKADTVAWWCRDGRLKGDKLPSGWRIKREELVKYLEMNQDYGGLSLEDLEKQLD